MNISHKSNLENKKDELENKKDEWDKFEEQEFSLDFLNISNKVALVVAIIFFSIILFTVLEGKW